MKLQVRLLSAREYPYLSRCLRLVIGANYLINNYAFIRLAQYQQWRKVVLPLKNKNALLSEGNSCCPQRAFYLTDSETSCEAEHIFGRASHCRCHRRGSAARIRTPEEIIFAGYAIN